MNQAAYACQPSVDYSAIVGDVILPFVFTLSESCSLLAPPAGQNQRFCYTVAGVGADTKQYEDLSHFVLSVCDQITEDMLKNVKVSIDGIAQDVVIGQNVSIETPQNPDAATGCPGLKFDFGLSKNGGVMEISFELSTPFPVGPTPVCLKGDQQVKKGLAICGPVCGSYDGLCPAVGHQKVSVCVPVTVTPYVRVFETSTYCCGAPVVTPGIEACPGTRLGSCSFTISQDVCVAVPVAFGAFATLGDYSVACADATAEGCADCVR